MRDIYKCRVCGRYVEEPIHCGVEAIPVLDSMRRVMLSKLLSGILRHYPWEIGVKPDEEGWVRIEELVKGIRERWRNKELYQWVRREHVEAIALLDPKGRFEVRDGYIRARYGHSIRVRIKYDVVEYDGVLYHGTSRDRLFRIIREGLKPMKRLYVHLTNDLETALDTGRRHGDPVVLVVDAGCLSSMGIKVYKATDKIYLVEYVPPQCIKHVIGKHQGRILTP